MKNGGIITANNRVKANFNEQMRKIVCVVCSVGFWPSGGVGAIKSSAVLQNIMRGNRDRTLQYMILQATATYHTIKKTLYEYQKDLKSPELSPVTPHFPTLSDHPVFLHAVCVLSAACRGRWACLQSAVGTSFCCYRQLYYAACSAAALCLTLWP